MRFINGFTLSPATLTCTSYAQKQPDCLPKNSYFQSMVSKWEFAFPIQERALCFFKRLAGVLKKIKLRCILWMVNGLRV